jgi:hypothetical protein
MIALDTGSSGSKYSVSSSGMFLKHGYGSGESRLAYALQSELV